MFCLHKAAVELGKSPVNSLNMLGNRGVFQYNGRQLEPWQITTQDFGGRWGTCPCEKKTKVNPSGIRTLEDFMGRMHLFNVHTVEAIPASTCFECDLNALLSSFNVMLVATMF